MAKRTHFQKLFYKYYPIKPAFQMPRIRTIMDKRDVDAIYTQMGVTALIASHLFCFYLITISENRVFQGLRTAWHLDRIYHWFQCLGVPDHQRLVAE